MNAPGGGTSAASTHSVIISKLARFSCRAFSLLLLPPRTMPVPAITVPHPRKVKPPFDEKFRQNYAEYLSLPYDEDLKEFRSSASVLGDKDFLARLSSKAGRLFLRPGRPAKENNSIANA